jgi:F420-non-reducing hydrogenase small subunit
MSGNGKPKFAMYWAAGCGGCEIAVLNTGPKLLDVDAAFDLAFWPVAMDAKVKDVQALPDGAITLTLFDGGIRSDENVAMARLLRRKSKILVSFGSCACEGSIPGLANLSPAGEIVETAFTTATSDVKGVRPVARWKGPDGDLHLPELLPVLRTLPQVVPVDYFMPGCPPESERISEVLDLVLRALSGQAELPPPGSVLGATASTVCETCARKRNEKTIIAFRRIQDGKTDPELCLLEQGIPCNGPATRGGCGALCPKAGAQCIGCYGPAEGVVDFGGRLIAAFGSVIDGKTPEEIERVLDGLPDPAGQFYRFSLAGCLLRAARTATGA